MNGRRREVYDSQEIPLQVCEMNGEHQYTMAEEEGEQQVTVFSAKEEIQIKKEKKKYKQHFRKEWLKIPRYKGWLEKMGGDDTMAVCNYCLCKLHARINDIERHCMTNKHKKAAEPYKDMQVIDIEVAGGTENDDDAPSDYWGEYTSPQITFTYPEEAQTFNDPPSKKIKPMFGPKKKIQLQKRVPNFRFNRPNIEKTDAFDHFGKFIAGDLRKMDAHQQVISKKLISDILYHGSLGELNSTATVNIMVESVSDINCHPSEISPGKRRSDDEDEDEDEEDND